MIEAKTAIAELQQTARAIEDQIGQVIVGQDAAVRGVLICLLADGHALLEGVPGLGKTVLVRTLGQVLDLAYSRIQFTPDLMPADLTGTHVILEDGRGGRQFAFQRGPVFANLVLADEINRATPKTQSALLEAMQEHQVTVGTTIHQLPQPFFVMATQNPIEMEGTYPLPEAELDRFFFKLQVGYPDQDEFAEILRRTTGGAQQIAERVADAARILEMQALVRQVPIASHVTRYVVRLVLATHPDHPAAPEVVKRYVRVGASPRAGQALVLAGKVLAALEGNYNVAFSDIRAITVPVLRHRLILSFEAEAQHVRPETILRELLASVPEDG